MNKERQKPPFWQRYQEKPEWSDYAESRDEVCEVYGVDPNEVHVHHIETLYDHLHEEHLEGKDLNRVENLYPFKKEGGEEDHTNIQDHKDLHNKLGRREYERRKRNGTLGR